MWYNRHLELKIKAMAKNFKVILVVGARQVGKSSLLTHLFPNLMHITFDPYSDQYGAKDDPELFLKNFPSPIILDEVQYMPELLSAIKRQVDKSDQKGQYLLTGSQNFSMLKNAAESMAGRVGIIELNGLTYFEEIQKPQGHWLKAYLDEPMNLVKNVQKQEDKKVFQAIWKGQFPGIFDIDEQLIPDYFASYVQTYLERDVRIFEDVSDIDKFDRFIRLCAAMTAQEINDAEFGRDLGLSSPTIKRWRARLESSYQWLEIPPYHGNTIKRLSKKKKGYFCDTGIACYLQRIPSSLTLASHPSLGALFETYCVRMLATLSTTMSPSPFLYHWRSSAGAEVDLVLDYNGCLYPIEIKCKSVLTKHDARGIQAFNDTYGNQAVAPCIILYTGDYPIWLTENIIALPWNSILSS